MKVDMLAERLVVWTVDMSVGSLVAMMVLWKAGWLGATKVELMVL